jgi:hypothetical protein
VLIGGGERSPPMLFLLLEVFCAVLAAPSFVLAMLQRRARRPGAYRYWHEATVFAITGVSCHLVLFALR